MNILINGGSKGIGRATAIKMSSTAENLVIVTGRDEIALRSLSEASALKNIECFGLDITSQDKRLTKLKNHLSDKKIRLDIIINTVGYLKKSSFLDSDITVAREMMEVNFFGPILLFREMIPYLSKGSHIVNIGSMGGFQGSVKFPGLSWYSSSKAALACMTESLAPELGKLGISINCICPGAVQTEMLEEAFPGYKAPVTDTDMAEFISYFALNGHRYFNGKILPVSLSTP